MKVDGILVYEDNNDNDWIITRVPNNNKSDEWIWVGVRYAETDPEREVMRCNSKTLPGLLRFIDKREKFNGSNSDVDGDS